MKCINCGTKMKRSIEIYHYPECGLRNIYLKNISIYKCLYKECGDEEVVIPQMEQLHDLIAKTVASQKHRLLPDEIRFLRTHLGFSGKNFAEKIGVAPESVSRWENGKQSMSFSSEMLLRVLTLSSSGPFRDYDGMEEFASREVSRPSRKIFLARGNSWISDMAA